MLIFVIIFIIVFINFSQKDTSHEQKSKRSEIQGEKKLGELFQKAPCKHPLVEENGICKYPEGHSCTCSTECLSSCICFEGNCTKKPLKSDNITNIVSDSVVCLDRSLLIFQNDHFILLPNLWNIQSCLSVCEGNRKELFILTEFGVYYLNSIVSNPVLMKTDEDKRFKKIIFFGGNLFGLSENKLWRNLKESIDFIRGRDISQEIISDVFSDGEVLYLFTENGKKLVFNGKKWREEESLAEMKLFEYSRGFEFTLSENDILIIERVEKNGKKFKVAEMKDISCFVTDPSDVYSIFVIERDTKSVKRINWSNNNIMEQLILSKGIELKRTKSYVWLITDSKCNLV